MKEEAVEPGNKSTVVVFLLAFLLGALGVHNVYIGRWKRGLVQFLLTVLTFGGGLVITIPWALVESMLILLGKYNFEPVETAVGAPTTLDKTESSKREYLLTSLLLAPLLALTAFTAGLAIPAAVVFYVVVGWMWNAITRMFITSVLPIYANVFSGGKKFLIRFSEYQLHPTSTRTELFRATRKMSLTAVFVLVFLISLVAQSNIGMVTEGNIPDAMVCQDGTVDLLGLCDEGQGGVADACDSSCVMENSTPGDRIFEAYLSEDILMFMMLSPFLTALVAPVLVLRYSSLSIVDKKTRSMSPIGEKANDLTNVAAGMGSVVLFFQTAWRIANAAVESGNIGQGIVFVGSILLTTVGLVLVFYPLIWLPMLRFTKAFEGHVLHLDNTLMQSKGIEIHELTYADNELRIAPLSSPNQTTVQHTPLVKEDMLAPTPEPAMKEGPSVDEPAQSTDAHGFEWTVHEGVNFYRKAGSNDPWTEYQS